MRTPRSEILTAQSRDPDFESRDRSDWSRAVKIMKHSSRGHRVLNRCWWNLGRTTKNIC